MWHQLRWGRGGEGCDNTPCHCKGESVGAASRELAVAAVCRPRYWHRCAAITTGAPCHRLSPAATGAPRRPFVPTAATTGAGSVSPAGMADAEAADGAAQRRRTWRLGLAAAVPQVVVGLIVVPGRLIMAVRQVVARGGRSWSYDARTADGAGPRRRTWCRSSSWPCGRSCGSRNLHRRP